MKRLILLFILLGLIQVLPAAAEPDMSVEQIERAILWVKPSMENKRISIYAKAISKASKQFRIDPVTLIAIAHQESSFRENLPMGKAGELGMLQIRRNWIKNPKFLKAFKKVREQDLKNPEKAFSYAAWILRDLRKSNRSGKLPFWTYYNARKFENRLRYYLRVKRHLTAIEVKKERFRMIATSKMVKATQRSISESPLVPVAVPSVQPREILNHINWHEKALQLFQEQES
jgi:soluble lytic murein transglycosylase-like protein